MKRLDVSPPVGPLKRDALGVVVPFDMEMDRELWRWAPEGIDLLLTRTPFVGDSVTVDFARDLGTSAPIEAAVRSVIAGRAQVVAYGCTSASFVSGAAGEREIRAAMERAGASQAVTTSGAIADALRYLGVSRVAVATPYTRDLSVLLDAFLGEQGIEVLQNRSLGLSRDIWNVPYAQTAELLRRTDRPDAQALVLSCTNLPSYDLIAVLERELGKPIVTANQATMWAALRRLGSSAVGPGQWLLNSTGSMSHARR